MKWQGTPHSETAVAAWSVANVFRGQSGSFQNGSLIMWLLLLLLLLLLLPEIASSLRSLKTSAEPPPLAIGRPFVRIFRAKCETTDRDECGTFLETGRRKHSPENPIGRVAPVSVENRVKIDPTLCEKKNVRPSAMQFHALPSSVLHQRGRTLRPGNSVEP